MSRLLLFLIFGVVLFAAPTAGEFDLRVWKLEHHWNRFVRDYWGCPDQARTRADCNPTLSKINRKEFEASRQAALALFEK